MGDVATPLPGAELQKPIEYVQTMRRRVDGRCGERTVRER